METKPFRSVNHRPPSDCSVVLGERMWALLVTLGRLTHSMWPSSSAVIPEECMSLTQSNCKEITNKEKGRQQRRRNRGGHNGTYNALYLNEFSRNNWWNFIMSRLLKKMIKCNDIKKMWNEARLTAESILVLGHFLFGYILQDVGESALWYLL